MIYFYYISTLIYKIDDIVEGNVVIKTPSLFKVIKLNFLTKAKSYAEAKHNFYILVFGNSLEIHKDQVLK